MPRPVRDSDDDTEAKAGRRTRLLADSSILNSPVRRSSRLKQPTKQSGASPDSPSNDTSSRTTRRRTGTLDSSAADSRRPLRPRKISDASDISELGDMDSGITQKRSTRRSLTATTAVDATKPTRLTRQFVRAGSETKSPAPTRTTRLTRASSVDPESINTKYKEETSTPTKAIRTRGRTSTLHLEPSVKEEGEDNDSFTSTDVDATQDHASESGSNNVSPNLSTSARTEQRRSGKSSKNTSRNKSSMEIIDEQDSPGNSTPDGSKISIDTDSGQVPELTHKEKSQETVETTDDTQMEITHNTRMKPLHNVSSHELQTSDSKNEILGSKNVDRQQSSPSNKENEDVNVHDRSLEKQKTDLVTKLAIVKDDVIRNVTLHEEYHKKDAIEVDSNVSLSVSVNTEIDKNPSSSNGSITAIKATDVQKEKLEYADHEFENKKSPVKKRLLYWEADKTLPLEKEEPDCTIDKVTTQPEINVTNEEEDIIVPSSKDEPDVANSKEITDSPEVEKTTKDTEQESLSTDESKPVDTKVDELKSITTSPEAKESLISESTMSEMNQEASYADEKMDVDEQMDVDESIVEVKETESSVKDTSLTLEGEELESSLLLKINNDSCVLNTSNKTSHDATVNENQLEDKEDGNQTDEDLKLHVSDDTRNTIEFASDVQQVDEDVSSGSQDDANNDTFTKFATETMEKDTSIKEISVEKPSEKTDDTEENKQVPVDVNHDDIPEPMETSDLPENKTINTSVKPATETSTENYTENKLQDKFNISTNSLPRDSINSMTDVKVLTKENDNDLLDTVENIEPSIVTESQTPPEVTDDLPPETEKEDTKAKEVRKRLSTGDLKMSRKNSVAGDGEMSNHEDGSEVDKSERPESNVDHSDSDTNIGSLFKDISAEEWNTRDKADNRPSSVNSANTEKAENDSETECDLVLVDKNAWQAAEKIKEMKSSQDLDYDSDDTVELKALADSMHEPADQENDDESDNASEASVHSAEKIAVDDEIESNEDIPVQDMNSSRRKSVDSKKLNSSRRKSLNETIKNSENTSTTELNSSKKRKSLLDSSKKNRSIRNVSTVEANAEKHANENISSPLIQKDLVGRRKSLNSSLIQSAVSHIAKKVMMDATSTPFKDKANLVMGSFGNITLFKKQEESSIHKTSLKTSKVNSELVDDDESGSDIVNVSSKKKQSQCISSDDEEVEEDVEEVEVETEEEVEQEEVKVDKGSGRKKKKLESPEKNSAKKNVNYSKVVEVDSSESNSDLESENSDWRNESRKIPRFLFAQAGDTSSEDSSEETDQKSIDSDIEKEYNLGGKSNLEYSDDNVPGDDCRPSETESSDSEDDGNDLKDFIVDDDEVENESEDEESEGEKAADEEVEEAENEAVEEEVVEEAEKEVVKEVENEAVEDVKMAETKETENEEIEKAESADEDEKIENKGIEKAENEEFGEAEAEEATDAKTEKDNNQGEENKVKLPYIVEENVETKIVPSENSGTMKFNVINISSPSSSPKLATKPTNSWLVDEDVKVETDKTSRDQISSPLDLMKKKRKRSGIDATPDLRSRKMKRMETTQEILIEEEEIETRRKPVITQRLEKRKLVMSEDVENEPVIADEIQKKSKKADKLKKIKETSENAQATVSKTKKNEADFGKKSKKQHQQADVESNFAPRTARSNQQTVEHLETVKSKKRKVQLEKMEEDIATELNDNKKQRKKAKKDVEKLINNRVSKNPQLEILSDSDEAPEVVAFAKAKEEALRAIKETTESIRIRKELQKKRQMDHLEKMRQEREQKERKAIRVELVRADKTEKTLKRLPSEVIENLSDVPRPRKKQKESKKLNAIDVLPSRSMRAPNVKVDENFITLSSASGSTTQFNIVNLQKAEKRAKKSVAIASYRQKMLARNSRQPVSTYLAYLRKQKASGKDKNRGKPF